MMVQVPINPYFGTHHRGHTFFLNTAKHVPGSACLSHYKIRQTQLVLMPKIFQTGVVHFKDLPLLLSSPHIVVSFNSQLCVSLDGTLVPAYKGGFIGC